MVQKIKIDPVTRIEGHLAIEVEVDGGKVTNAWSKGTMFRGFEELLKGRDPRDASYVTDRVCGVCSGSHQWASALCLDDAFDADVPDGGRLVRNLILGAQWLHDHPLHFYHLSALDYIDVMAVAKYKGNDAGLNAVKDKILKLVKAQDTAPLTPRYEPDEFSVDDPELVTMAVAHYLKALEMQAKAKKMGALLGGKMPHSASIVVGGVTMYPEMQYLDQYRSLLTEQTAFIENVYVPDVVTFGTGPLFPLAKAGIGAAAGHYLSFGGFQNSGDKKDLLYPAGVVIDSDLKNIKAVDTDLIKEYVKHAWYDDNKGLHPSQGETAVNPDKKDAYSFIKSPRYEGRAMEVGPLARMLVAQPDAFMKLVVDYGVKPGAVARHAARAVETLALTQQILKWLDELTVLVASGKCEIHATATWEGPESGTGVGLTEAPRGALGHWIKIKDKKIENYQLVVPSTWNLSPRDDSGVLGPVEQALIGAPVPDVENPINLVRIVRSFDPCISCAVHVIEPNSNRILKFKIG
ncbi:MAG: nickel-dependent hydrogenase large subunit [Candidatus Aquicultor sp.]|nr:nickel-dependent hydrogenase large subunit [Candidatus Aquicultor sp.]